jgi:hypothetical protein
MITTTFDKPSHIARSSAYVASGRRRGSEIAAAPLLRSRRSIDHPHRRPSSDQRPWFPTLILREIAEGAPHLDVATLDLLRTVFAAFGRILTEGQAAGQFRSMHPVLAYMSIIGPLVFNSARERIAAQPGRENLPMLVGISHVDLVNHLQQAAHRILATNPPTTSS